MTPPADGYAPGASSPGLRRALGLPSLVVYGLAYIAPITVFTTYGVATVASRGRLTLSYLVATTAMLLTAVSYSRLAREFPAAGSVYTYASRALHPTAGFLAGWAIALDYLMIPVINLLVIGIFGSALVPSVPAAAWMLSALALTTTLNLRGIETTDRAATLVLALELAAIGTFVAVAAGGAGPVPAEARPPVTPAALLAGAAILALSFLGFDAITTLAEEAREPARDIPRAVVTTCLVAGALFCGVSVLAYRAHPVIAFDEPDAAGFLVAETLGGRPLAGLVAAGEIVGAFASAIAAQAGAARLHFGISRDTGLLPRLADVHPVRQTPDAGIWLTAVVGLLAFLLPLEKAVSLVNFGALCGFLAVHASAARYFVGRGRASSTGRIALALVVPVLGTIFVGGLLWGLPWGAKSVGALWLAIGCVVAPRRPRTISGSS
jgi:amino acid transporter